MRFLKSTLVLVVVALGAGPVNTLAASVPHLYITPTAGFLRWDSDLLPGWMPVDRTDPVWGARIGVAPIEAFSGEFVFLTGANDLQSDGDQAVLEPVRVTQLEVSFLVNFQSLVGSPVYPYLDLGAGLSMRKADDNAILDDSKFVFHLGGGLKADLQSRLALRFNVRDTFFTETQDRGNEEIQVTVDSVELSLGLEYRLPLGTHRGSGRLR